MTSVLTKLKYYRERAQVLAFVFQHAFYSKNPRGELPLYNWMKFIALGMKERFPLITQLEASEAGSEAMKPSIKGIKDEWVLHRVLLPRSVKVHVGDVLCVSLDTATTAASHSQVRPQATTTLYSHTISVNAHTPAELPTSRSSSSIAPDPCNTTTVKEEPCDSTVTARPTVVFRRVAAVAGDEIESPQPSDAPFRIEDNHFWVVADNPDVPAQEAWDSRTFGPVHLEDVLGRALYVVRSMQDHGPIQNSPQAMEEDAAVMAGEGDLESVMQRVRGMQLR